MKKLKVKSYKLQVLTALAVATLSAGEGFAQTARDTGKYSFSLQQAIDFAMKTQLQVQNANYDEQIASAKVKETVGIGLPQISGSFDVKDFIDIPTTVLPDFITPSIIGVNQQYFGLHPLMLPVAGDGMPVKFGTQYNAAAGISASQLLFSSDYLVGLQATKTYLELTRKATQRTRIDVSVAVTKAYYSVLINNERMKTMDANIERIKKLMEDTKALNENGFVEKIDLDRITVTYNNLLVEKEKLNRLIGLGLTLLKFQVGMDQSATLALTDKLEGVKFQPELSTDKFDYGKRIEYSLLETQKSIAQLQVKQNKMSYLPNAVLYGSLSENAYRSQFDIFANKPWYPTVVVGGTINVPIFDGLQKNYRIQQAKVNLLKSDNNLKSVQQAIDMDRASAQINLQNASSTLDSQKKNIELAEEVYKVSKIKYDQGVGSNLEVVTAETALKEAQTNYFSALYDAIISKVDYDKANGLIK